MKSPDDVCGEYLKKEVKIKLKYKDDFILIESDKEGLLFLADLIRAQALFDKDCGYKMFPKGSGSKFFETSSDMGIYIHVKSHAKCPEGHISS